MKKVLLITALTAIAITGAMAQTVYVQGGLNLANITTTDNGETKDSKALTTFNVGGMVRFGLSDVLDLESGLLFSGKGAKTETYFNNNEDYIKAKFNPYYIEMPLNAVVKFPLQEKTNIFIYAGPYVAMGVSGKVKFNAKAGPLEYNSSEDIEFSNDDPTTSDEEGSAYDRLKRFDYGANFGAGIDAGSVLIKLNYGLGLAKINSTSTDNDANDKNKYRTFSISLGIPLK